MGQIQNFVTAATSDPNYEMLQLFQFYYKFHVKSLKKCFSPTINFLSSWSSRKMPAIEGTFTENKNW